ncbi:MAG: PAS domain-containing protein [Gemmatimonadales bacterium]|nr:MAG: PAS domain-containing protein [Gemmatimonadales bacterium]
MVPGLKKICAWCGDSVAEGDPGDGVPGERVSHGICPTCAHSLDLQIQSVVDMHQLTHEEHDQLPFGVIEVDGEGVILGYNDWESRFTTFAKDRVMGRNFFTEVAPCTAVRSFLGEFEEMVASGRPDRRELDYTFELPTGQREVHIILTWQPEPGWGFILVREATT